MAVRAIVAEVNREPAIFGEPTVVRDEWGGTHGFLASIPVLANMAGGDPPESYYVHEAFNGQSRRLPHLHQRDLNVYFAVNDLSDEIANALRAAITNADEQVAHLRRIRMEQTRTHEEFASIVRERFGALPGR